MTSASLSGEVTSSSVTKSGASAASLSSDDSITCDKDTVQVSQAPFTVLVWRQAPTPLPQRIALTAQRHMAYHVLGPTCTLLSAILPRTSSLNYQHFVQHPPILHINICQLCV